MVRHKYAPSGFPHSQMLSDRRKEKENKVTHYHPENQMDNLGMLFYFFSTKGKTEFTPN